MVFGNGGPAARRLVDIIRVQRRRASCTAVGGGGGRGGLLWPSVCVAKDHLPIDEGIFLKIIRDLQNCVLREMVGEFFFYKTFPKL